MWKSESSVAWGKGKMSRYVLYHMKCGQTVCTLTGCHVAWRHNTWHDVKPRDMTPYYVTNLWKTYCDMMLSIVSGDAMFPTRVNYINFSPNIPTLSYVVCKVVYRAIPTLSYVVCKVVYRAIFFSRQVFLISGNVSWNVSRAGRFLAYHRLPTLIKNVIICVTGKLCLLSWSQNTRAAGKRQIPVTIYFASINVCLFSFISGYV